MSEWKFHAPSCQLQGGRILSVWFVSASTCNNHARHIIAVQLNTRGADGCTSNRLTVPTGEAEDDDGNGQDRASQGPHVAAEVLDRVLQTAGSQQGCSKIPSVWPNCPRRPGWGQAWGHWTLGSATTTATNLAALQGHTGAGPTSCCEVCVRASLLATPPHDHAARRSRKPTGAKPSSRKEGEGQAGLSRPEQNPKRGLPCAQGRESHWVQRGIVPPVPTPVKWQLPSPQFLGTTSKLTSQQVAHSSVRNPYRHIGILLKTTETPGPPGEAKAFLQTFAVPSAPGPPPPTLHPLPRLGFRTSLKSFKMSSPHPPPPPFPSSPS